MADLLIKGVDMPSCGVYSAEIGVLDEKTAVITICTPIDEPQRGYRLVQIPPHGRLIDAGELYDLIDGGYDIDFDEVPETKRELLRMVSDATTIIEASEDGEQDG